MTKKEQARVFKRIDRVEKCFGENGEKWTHKTVKNDLIEAVFKSTRNLRTCNQIQEIARMAVFQNARFDYDHVDQVQLTTWNSEDNRKFDHIKIVINTMRSMVFVGMV